jgi:hypothetical protein
MSDEKRVATAEILNTSVHVSAKLNDRYQGPPGPPGKDGSMRFEDLTEAQIEQLRGPQGLTGKTPQMTVQVETGEPGTEASVIQSGTAEAPVIALTIPRGSTGATPQITVQVKTGEPGTAASVKQTGTVEAPVIELTIPRGDTGNIGSLTINGKTPDSAGKVELTAADVGARADDWMPTAADVGALSGTDATLTQAGEAADAEKVGEELNHLKNDVNAKVNQSDALTLEEILASTDLTNKVAGAEAVKTIKNDITSLKQGGFYTEKNKGNTMPADYGGFIRITGSSWPGSFVSDTYYLGVASDGTAYSGTQINGNKQVTWKAL